MSLVNRKQILETIQLVVTDLYRMNEEGKYGESQTNGQQINFHRWEWQEGVGLYGLFRLYQETQDMSIYSALHQWYTDYLENKTLPAKQVNSMAPLLTLSFLYQQEPNPLYKQTLDEWAAWALKEMPRTAEQGLQHIVAERPNTGQLWCDTIFMTGLFLASYGKLFQKPEYIQEASRQVIVHLKYLTDRKTGLFYHGWTFDGNHHFAEALWGRGNAWWTAGLPEFLAIAEVGDGAVKDTVIGALERQVQALAHWQREDGLWTTLINDPHSYPELSATAGFGYGILRAIRLGVLDNSYQAIAFRALTGVLSQISETGSVRQVSGGTPMGHDLQFYHDIPILPAPYGNSLAILFLTEVLHHCSE